LKRPGLGHPVIVINLDGTEEPMGTFLKPLTDKFAAYGDALQAEILGAISVLESAFDELP
jgi:hypothetical protein